MIAHRLVATIALGASLLLVLVSPARAVTPEADQAWALGNQDEARRLYEKALAKDPDDTHALFRSAQLHAWARLFDLSIARWDQLLALEPENASARLERAKTLSWAGRHAEAARAFREILESDGPRREARLGLARTLSWSGRQAEARGEYERLLQDNPLDIEALVGVAQTRAWSGDLEGARAGYERVLALEPDQRVALTGLAYVELWQGRHEEARKRIERLRDLAPEDPDLADLVAAEERARAPWLRLAYDRLSDSEDTERDIYSLLWGRRLVAPLDLLLGAERHEPRSPGLDASVTRVFGALTWRPTQRWRLYARGGLDRSKDSTGEIRSTGVGALAATRLFRGGWEAGGALTRDTLIYSPAITNAEIEIDRLALHVAGTPSEHWRTRAEIGLARFSDDNERSDAMLGVWRRWKRDPVNFEIGPVARWMDFDEDLDNGYFDPRDFSSLILQAEARGPFGGSRYYFELGVEAGWQSFTIGATKVSGDGVFGGRALLGRWLGDRFAAELYAAYSDYAVESATGFDFTQFGLRLRYRWVN